MVINRVPEIRKILFLMLVPLLANLSSPHPIDAPHDKTHET
jgi:hypothetical protein